MSRNIYYKGITSDTNKVIKECPICNIKINYKNKNKREISKLIIFKRPKFRYIGDLSDIPSELKAGKIFIHFYYNRPFLKIFGRIPFRRQKKRKHFKIFRLFL